MTETISIIIPVYREQHRVNAAVAALRRLPGAAAMEIIVVDGDPDGRTIALITDGGVKSMTAPRGRGAQMNAGAAVATGGTLLFLHVDTRLPDNAIARVREVAADPRSDAGAFSFAYDSDRLILRIFSRLSTLRCRLTRLPYGDQAIFVNRGVFLAVGGFPEIPLMEDHELVRRLKRRGKRLRILPEAARTSPRRIECDGIFRSAVRTALLVILYAFGVSSARLKRYYPDAVEPADVKSSQSPVRNRLRNRRTV